MIKREEEKRREIYSERKRGRKETKEREDMKKRKKERIGKNIGEYNLRTKE